jgi:hypothetical protein
MICLVALDFVLRVARAGVMDVAFIVHVLGVNSHDVTGDPADLGIPTHVITDFERICHDASHNAYFQIVCFGFSVRSNSITSELSDDPVHERVLRLATLVHSPRSCIHCSALASIGL